MIARWLTVASLVVSLFATCLPGGSPAQAGGTGGSTASSRLPLTFIENRGQVDPEVRFYLPGTGRDIWLAEDAIWVTVRQADEDPRISNPAPIAEGRLSRVHGTERSGVRSSVHLKISFPGANPHPRLEPMERLETRVSYFIGADPTKWRTDIPVWGGVRYVGLYPGVDLEVSGQSGTWQWRTRVTPGAALGGVRLRVEGADELALEGGRLRVATWLGKFSLPLLATQGGLEPEAAAQLAGDQVLSPFAAANETGSAAIPAADRSADLLYATFLGGSDSDWGKGIAVDNAGSAYVTGVTGSSDFPAASGPGYDTTYNGDWGDAFVVKLNPTGTALSYVTFLGGSSTDEGKGIAVDSAGYVYVTGATDSSDFPAASGPGYDTSYNGDWDDAFVVKLKPAGTALSYATFLGGSGVDIGYGIAADSAGSAYVTGWTSSSDFPAASGPGYDTSYDDYNNNGDAFVVELNPAGTTLRYATFLEGARHDYGYGIAVDNAGSAYVTGETGSSDFPAASGPGYDTTYNGDWVDAFVVKLNPAGTALSYATFLGGSDYDWGQSIAVDGAGSAYVTGSTLSDDFPASSGPGYDTTHNGYAADPFVVKLNPAGTALGYATFLGGSDADTGSGIAVDDAGSAYVTGWTESGDFPAVSQPGYDTSYNGSYDTFVVKLTPAGTALSYATFLSSLP